MVMPHESALAAAVARRPAVIHPMTRLVAAYPLVRPDATAGAAADRWFVSATTASLRMYTTFTSEISRILGRRANLSGSVPTAVAAALPGSIQVNNARIGLAARPGQTLAPAPVGYVYAQTARPQAAGPAAPAASSRQEIVEMVQKEIRNVMSSGTVTAQLTRFDFTRIADQVETLLNRRLVIDRERLGLPPR